MIKWRKAAARDDGFIGYVADMPVVYVVGVESKTKMGHIGWYEFGHIVAGARVPVDTDWKLSDAKIKAATLMEATS